MIKLFLVIPLIFLFGCATTNSLETVITKNTDGYTITMDSPGKVEHTDGDTTVSVDLRDRSLLQTLTEAAVVQGLERKGD